MTNQSPPSIKHKNKKILYVLYTALSLTGWLTGVLPMLFSDDGWVMTPLLLLYAIPVTLLSVTCFILGLFRIKSNAKKELQTELLWIILAPGLIGALLLHPFSFFSTVGIALILMDWGQWRNHRQSVNTGKNQEKESKN